MAELSSFFEQFDEATVAISIADPEKRDIPLVYVNKAFSDLTGYPAAQILYRNCRFLQGGLALGPTIDKFRIFNLTHEPISVLVQNQREDGSIFNNFVVMKALHLPRKRVLFLGCQYEFGKASKPDDLMSGYAQLQSILERIGPSEKSAQYDETLAMQLQADQISDRMQRYFDAQSLEEGALSTL